jgi:hypothetical protein
MAKTLTVGKALEIVGVRYPKVMLESIGARFASEVRDFMWHAFPWKVSLGDLVPFGLVQDQADYGPPYITLPSDFYGIHDAWIRDYANELYPLTVETETRVSWTSDIPTTISVTELGNLRIHPRPIFYGPDYWLEGKYKKSTSPITPSNINSTVLPWDDIYFEVFRRGLIWKVKEELIGDPKAADDLSIWMTWLQKMIAHEQFQDGVTTIHPRYPLTMG